MRLPRMLRIQADDGRSILMRCRDPRVAQGRPLPFHGLVEMSSQDFDELLLLLPAVLRETVQGAEVLR